MAVVSGKAFWACVQKPNTTFEPCWTIDVEVDDSTAKELIKQGLAPRKNTTNTFRFKRNVENKATGESNRAPKVMDKTRAPFEQLIGNGSEVKVQYRLYDWEWKKKKGIGADLQAVMVVKHIPYGGEDGDELDPETDELVDENDVPF